MAWAVLVVVFSQTLYREAIAQNDRRKISSASSIQERSTAAMGKKSN
jgi:hypothetical protein